MKKLCFLLFIGLAVAGLAAAQASTGGTMYAANEIVELKSSTGIFSSTKGTIRYGDQVSVLNIDGRFAEVRNAQNSSGWTALANLTTKQVRAGTTGASSVDGYAMAGKGFDKEVENSYKTQGNYNYDAVDRVEAITVNMADFRRFLEEGRLKMGDK